MGYFDEALFNLNDKFALTTIFLPFILIFVVLFAILQKTRILGDEKKKLNGVVAFVMALLVVIAGEPYIKLLGEALPQVSLVIIAVIMLLILIGLMGGEARWMGGSMSGWVAIISFLIIIYIFGGAAGWFGSLPNWLGWLDDPDTQALVLIILVFGIIIWFITKEEGGEEKVGALSRFSKDLGDLFKKE